MNPAVSNSEHKIIVLYDSILTHDKSRVISHELAHFYWDFMSDLEKEKYNDIAQWKKSKDGQTTTLNRKDVLIEDSFAGPHEDFSNNVELFLFQKDSLNKNPELIHFLEKIIQ
jgi:hypothetical protein